MAIEELEARIRLLEDIEAIKKLKATYGYLADALNWQGMVNLFTDDAIADFGPMGRYEGKEELTKCLRDIAFPASPFTVHMFHNPIIEVRGEKATGEWYFEVPATHAPPNRVARAAWMAGKYEEQYVKVGGEWKFKMIVAKVYYDTPYDEGWVKTKMYE